MSKADTPANQPRSTPPSDLPQPQPYDIPVEGSLGLLAAGYRGLIAWREKRAEAKAEVAKKNG